VNMHTTPTLCVTKIRNITFFASRDGQQMKQRESNLHMIDVCIFFIQPIRFNSGACWSVDVGRLSVYCKKAINSNLHYLCVTHQF